MNPGLAMGAGFLGTAMGMRVMMLDEAAMERMRSGGPAGHPPDWVGLLGRLLVPGGGDWAFWAGIGWHYLNGILFALLYATLLLAAARQSSAPAGAAFGLVVWLFAMLLAAPAAALHPLVRAGDIPRPGVFLLALGHGWTPGLFSLLDHLLYGTLLGTIYKHRPRDLVT